MLFAILLVSLIALLFLCVMKQKKMFKLTEHIPGPSPLPFIGNSLELGTNTEEFLKNLQRLTKTYGGIVRLYMGSQISVLLTDAKYIAQVLTATDSYYKGNLYKIVQPMVGQGLLTSSGETWARQRRILNPAFSNKQLGKYVVVFNSVANMLVDQLKQLCHLDYVDVTEPVFALTLQSVCKTVMGVDVTKSVDYHQSIDKLTDLFFKRFISPVKLIDFVYRFTGDYRETKNCAEYIDGFVRGVMAKRKQEFTAKGVHTKYTSLLDEMLRLSGEDVLTEDEILDQIKSFVFAGSDTVGVTLSFAMYELAKHPDVQAKILEEIEFVFGTNFNGDINFESLPELRYTECVVKEIMRMYAPAVFITRTLPNEMYFDDLHVPADTVAIIYIYGLHHSENYYPNPEKFDPDRFLPENASNQPKNSYIPFSAGARVCIGNKFAMLEAKLTLAKIVRNFELSERPGHEPILVAAGTLKSVNGLPVKIKARRSSTA